MLKFFAAEKSTLNLPGPRRMLRPAVPYVPGVFTRNDSVGEPFPDLCPRAIRR